MNWGLVLAFLFAVGSLGGWVLEFFFRNLISHNGPKGKFFINPGFCRGPYLPIYGMGMAVMFTISYFLTKGSGGSAPKPVTLLAIGAAMSLIEFAGGLLLLKVMNIRLWDYRKYPGNIMGLVCPLFSLIWTVLGGLYDLLIHPLAIDGLIWLSKNLAFSFMIGLFFGFFILDMYSSCRDALIIKEFGDDNEVIVRYEELKALVQQRRIDEMKKTKFFNQAAEFGTDLRDTLSRHLAESRDAVREAGDTVKQTLEESRENAAKAGEALKKDLQNRRSAFEESVRRKK